MESIIILALLFIFVSPFQGQVEYTKPEIKVEYDRFKDETAVTALIPLKPGNMASEMLIRDYMKNQLGPLAGLVGKMDHLVLILVSKNAGPKPVAQSKIGLYRRHTKIWI